MAVTLQKLINDFSIKLKNSEILKYSNNEKYANKEKKIGEKQPQKIFCCAFNSTPIHNYLEKQKKKM